MLAVLFLVCPRPKELRISQVVEHEGAVRCAVRPISVPKLGIHDIMYLITHKLNDRTSGTFTTERFAARSVKDNRQSTSARQLRHRHIIHCKSDPSKPEQGLQW